MRKNIVFAAAIAASILTMGRSKADTILFADNFNRGADTATSPSNATPQIDASVTGISGTVGSTFTAGTVYSYPYHDPFDNNADASAANGGGQVIQNTATNGVYSKVKAGTANLFINHNFTESTSFVVSVDLAAINDVAVDKGGGFAIGMTNDTTAGVASAPNTGDASNGHLSGAAANGFKMTNGLTALPGDPSAGTVVSDFWVALHGDKSMAWGIGGAASPSLVKGSVTGLSTSTGTISAIFSADDFNAGTAVAYQVYYSSTPGGPGTLEGSGVFQWTHNNANYIGLDARDSTKVSFDNFNISTASPIPEPTSIGLLGFAGLALGRRSRRR